MVVMVVVESVVVGSVVKVVSVVVTVVVVVIVHVVDSGLTGRGSGGRLWRRWRRRRPGARRFRPCRCVYGSAGSMERARKPRAAPPGEHRPIVGEGHDKRVSWVRAA